jgi:hypothetical protein
MDVAGRKEDETGKPYLGLLFQWVSTLQACKVRLSGMPV